MKFEYPAPSKYKGDDFVSYQTRMLSQICNKCKLCQNPLQARVTHMDFYYNVVLKIASCKITFSH